MLRVSTLLFIVCLVTWTAEGPRATSTNEAAALASPQGERAQHLKVDGTRFVRSDGDAFQWRGITAFRLLDYVADGREAEANTYLAWAASKGLTVVRVLGMVDEMFNLRPEDGRRALPPLLRLAEKHGVYVEVVALASTAAVRVNLEEHLHATGEILAAHPNALLEIANEPVHPAQALEVHRADLLQSLRKLVPAAVPVSVGSIESGDGFGAGDYITWHPSRDSGQGGWEHVLELAEGAGLLSRWKKPVVSDEPIGAGSEYEPGRRDNSPARFRAAALMTRLAGLGATFHYEGGLQAVLPTGRQLECFDAWNEAWTLLPEDIDQHGGFRKSGGPEAILSSFDAARAIGAFERIGKDRGWVLVLGPPGAALTLRHGWRIAETRPIEDGMLLTVVRSAG